MGVEAGRPASLECFLPSVIYATGGKGATVEADYIGSMPSANPFRALIEHRNFRIFWFGQTLSLIGTWMQTMAVGWLAFEVSNSPFLVGLVASAATWPIVGFSLFAGVVVERRNKLELVRAAQALLLAQALTLWWFT